MGFLKIAFFTALLVFGGSSLEAQPWSKSRASQWYARQPWLVGSNFIPKNAVNQLEMWQFDTFDPEEINLELGLAEKKLGMNTMRVFLHDLVWSEDPISFSKRIEEFLRIADSHHIKILFVLFDSCWDPHPQLGRQRTPTPGVHNSAWVQSPGADSLADPTDVVRLHNYVYGVIHRFAHDRRILGWDLWNEPGNTNDDSYAESELKDKVQIVKKLLPQVFEWAREAKPTQPLTSGLQGVPLGKEEFDDIGLIQLQQSDIITFHSYEEPEVFREDILRLKTFGRPILCTEYMARTEKSTLQGILPLAREFHVGAYNWGLVSGKTQTIYPWDSWQHHYAHEPEVWFHDLLRDDGTLYSENKQDSEWQRNFFPLHLN